MNRGEEISFAWDYGAKSIIDHKLKISPEPPEHWPAEAKQDFHDGRAWAAEANFLRWGKRYD